MQDYGIGIPADKIENIFFDFSKLDDPRQLNVEGTGLGLSISKSIVERMHGDVSVTSEVNRGTSFMITMRAKIQLQSGSCFIS